MVRALLCAALLLVPAPAIPQTAPPLKKTLYSDDTPPERFRGEAAAIVIMVSPEKIDELCGKAPPGRITLACTHFEKDVPIIVIPNPCIVDEEDYAHVLCHEKGHALGWPRTHGA